jgi:hypothetical protein
VRTYLVEWHMRDENKSRDAYVSTENPSDETFAVAIANSESIDSEDVMIYSWFVSGEPRSSLTGRWGSIFRN